MIQNTWDESQLGDEIELIYGKGLPKHARAEGSIPVFGSNGIVGHHSDALVKGPGIIIGRKGSCGEVHYCENDFWPIDTTYYVALKKKHDLRFLYYYLKTLGLTEKNSHSTIPGLNRELAYEIKCKLPEYPEQRKITAILLQIQKAIEIQERIIATTRELKKSTMEYVFTYGLRGEKTKETEIGRTPNQWSLKKFGEFSTLKRGYDLPVQDRRRGIVPVVGSNGVCGYHNYSKAKGPGVITGRSGSLGISYYIEDDYWPLNTSLYVQNFHGNDPLYTHYYFEVFDFKKYSSGVSVPTLNRNLVHEAIIAVPPKDEQQEIAKIFKTIDEKYDFHAKKHSILQNLFKAMLSKLMTGEIRVRDLEIDVSEVM